MSKGKDLSPTQVKHALEYNLAHHSFRFLMTVRGAVGLKVDDPVDDIMEEFKKKGFVWRRTDGYPTEYLPGDFICTLLGAEGHSGIVMQHGPTKGGATPPIVMQLPGPSTQMSDGTYSPESTNDVTIGPWSIWRTTRLHTDVQFLGRILRSKIGD